jgi:hypothetical protein
MEREKILKFITYCAGALICFCIILFCLTFAIIFLFATVDVLHEAYNHFILPYEL